MQTQYIKEWKISPDVFFISDWTKHQKIKKIQNSSFSMFNDQSDLA